MKTPKAKVMTPDLTRLPLEFIGGAIGILNTIITEKTLPPPALLYLGVFEIPAQPGEYIALPWSPPGIDPKLRFPIQRVNISTARDIGGRLISSIVSEALGFIEVKSRKQWAKQTVNEVFQDRSRDGKLTTDQFSANLRVSHQYRGSRHVANTIILLKVLAFSKLTIFKSCDYIDLYPSSSRACHGPL